MDLPPLPEAVLTPREAFYAKTGRVPFEKSAGRICTEIVSPYPPGIPILVPGERITQELVEYIKLVFRHGGFINGPEDIRLHTIKVVA
jgi:arginine/lysine/ornithine decarboxylase